MRKLIPILILLTIPTILASETLYFDPSYKIEDGQIVKMIPLPTGFVLKKGEETYYISTDHLGSTSKITDTAGQVVSDYDYYPYGQELSFSGQDVTEHKYTGQIFDDSTDLYYYKARYYNPNTGSFISADTVDAGYNYANNNPLRYVDISGYFPIEYPNLPIILKLGLSPRPTPTIKYTSKSPYTTYTVVERDTFYGIAFDKFGFTFENINEFINANPHIPDINNIKVGDILYTPSKTSTFTKFTPGQTSYTTEELRMLTNVIYAEGFDDPEKLMPLIASVAINRLNANKPEEFGSTLTEVLKKGYSVVDYSENLGNLLYGYVLSGKFPDNPIYKERYQIAFRIAKGILDDTIPLKQGHFYFIQKEINLLYYSGNFDFELVKEETPVEPYRVFSYK